MTIKLNNVNDFITFYEKYTNDATMFYLDNTNSNESFMVCDCKYTITYECANHDERNNIIDYLNSKQIKYITLYNQVLPQYDYDLTTITM